MTHLSQHIPYRDSKISYNQSKVHIEEMLKETGAIALRWTETPEAMKGLVMPTLEFMITSKMKGIENQFAVRIQPPLLIDIKGRGYRQIKTPNRNASMRLLYWYLKSRLEAVRFGLDDVFDTFMSRVINSLPDGRDATLGETIRNNPEVIRGILPTFEIKALPVIERENQHE